MMTVINLYSKTGSRVLMSFLQVHRLIESATEVGDNITDLSNVYILCRHYCLWNFKSYKAGTRASYPVHNYV